MHKTETILRRADDLITEQGWTQGRSVDPNTGAICLGQAIALASEYIEGRISAAAAMIHAEQTLLGVIEYRDGLVYGYIFQWNDRPVTTVEDVHLLVKEGIEAAAERSDR